MDAIARYQYTVNLDGTVTVTMASDYAAGGIIQHMGYVISGTTEDGTDPEVRDSDTGSGSDMIIFSIPRTLSMPFHSPHPEPLPQAVLRGRP